MKKTLTDVMLTHSLLGNIINLEEIITKKDVEINGLEEEINELESLMNEHGEKNISLMKTVKMLTEENYILSQEVNAVKGVNAVKDAMQCITNKDKSYSFAEGVSFDVADKAQLAIFTTCEKLCAMLIEKNKIGEKSTVTPLQLLQAFIHIIK